MGLSFSKPKEVVTNYVHIRRDLICHDGGCSQFRELEQESDTTDVLARFQERLRLVIASPSTSPSERAMLKAYLKNLIQGWSDIV